MKQPINIRIDQKLLEKIKSQAAKEKRSVTNLIEFAMEKYISGKL